MEVENMKMVQYYREQFFLEVNIITRHEKANILKKNYFSG